MLLTNITYFYHDDFDDDEGRQLTFSRNENNNVIFVFLLNKLRRPSPWRRRKPPESRSFTHKSLKSKQSTPPQTPAKRRQNKEGQINLIFSNFGTLVAGLRLTQIRKLYYQFSPAAFHQFKIRAWHVSKLFQSRHWHFTFFLFAVYQQWTII